MLSIVAKTKEGQKVFDLPETPEEVKLPQALRFNHVYEEMLTWRRSEVPDDQLSWETMLDISQKREYLTHVINCVSKFFDLPEEEFLGLKKGSILKHLTDLSSEKLDQLAGDLLSIFTHIYNVLNQYRPRLRGKEDCVFIHNNQRFKIPYFLAESIYGNDDDLTVSESIECAEVRRLVKDMKTRTKDPIHPVTATYLETVGITAILARLDNGIEDEVLPDDPYLANQFVERRKEVFKDIDYVNGSDLIFFLTRIGKN